MEETNIPYYEDFKKYLRTTAPLSDEAIAMITPYIKYRTLGKGEVIQEPFEECSKVFMIRKGIVRSFMHDKSNVVTRWFAIEGDVFTSMISFYDGSISPTCIETITKAEFWEIDMNITKAILHQSDEWRSWLLKMFIGGIAVHEIRDYQFISKDAYTRFKNLADYRSKEFLNQIPLSILASYLKMTPRTLSRCRNRYIREEMKK